MGVKYSYEYLLVETILLCASLHHIKDNHPNNPE